MLNFVDNLARKLLRRGLRRGLLEGNPTWIAVTVLAGVLRLLTRPQPPQIHTEELRVGESVIVTHLPPARIIPVEPARPPAVSDRPFEVGERVLLIDRKERRYLVRLRAGATFDTHSGVLDHDTIIGSPEGGEVQTRQRSGSEGPIRTFLALRPTLSDVIFKMPRGAQVIYPKDLGAILIAADLFPGARVLESGVGSGALSIAALRAGCQIVGYEIRPDFATQATANVNGMLGDEVPFVVETRDVYEGIAEKDLDRILLDLPEPWRVLEHAATALRPGGILCAYLPSINQTAELRSGLAEFGFGMAETLEVLHRTWHIEGRSVRPDHRMIGHTGFITTARRLLRSNAARSERFSSPR